MIQYIVTTLENHKHYYCSKPDEVYDLIFRKTDNHEWAEELSSWCELAPLGDNWTAEEIDIDVAITEDD